MPSLGCKFNKSIWEVCIQDLRDIFKNTVRRPRKDMFFFKMSLLHSFLPYLLQKNAVPYIIHDVYVCKITNIGLTEIYDDSTKQKGSWNSNFHLQT